ncbi:MAG: SAM-dependent methyltransferase, partial [Pseudomonas sp.]|nr:SAM-dependent methyltransferase [Pseudomonas sp.]
MVEQQQGAGIRVEALAPQFQAQAEAWAERLGLPLVDEAAEFAVQLGGEGLQIQ